VRLAVAATPDVAIPTLDALLESAHHIVAVITQPDRPAGRGRVLTASPVSDWADQHQITTIKPSSPDDLLSVFSGIDCVVTIGYGVILPEKILSLPKYGFINLHFSLLPKWRGAAPVQRSIEAGDTVTGVTVFKLDPGMDTGPIYLTREIQMDSSWNSADLLERLAALGAGAVMETLALIESGVVPTPQNSEGVSRAHKLSTSEGEINWSAPRAEITRKILAFTPSPGAWTKFRGATLKIVKTGTAQTTTTLKPGEIALESAELVVGTLDGPLQISHVTPSGKSSMSAMDWARGVRITEGEYLG
jgi:methionyl-tRNA formyltransferase